MSRIKTKFLWIVVRKSIKLLRKSKNKSMLSKRLMIKTAPKAHAGNILFWENYRVSVLGERLFRLEQSDGGIFRDEATQAVLYRDMPQSVFTFTKQGRRAVIATPACRLILAKDRGQVCVELNGKRILADNEGNLLGTCRTLDNQGNSENAPWKKQGAEKFRLGVGVCSKTGVAVLQDDTLSLGKDGLVKNARADGTDEYIFAYGNDYRGALSALYQLTGKPPLVPRFALGNWWSRYHAYTDEEYLRVLAAFEERKIPLSVATLDMDWHYSNEKQIKKRLVAQGKYKREYIGECAVNVGWTGYSWDRRLFPKPKEFLKKVKDKGLKITLNLHPADGVRFWEDGYEKMAKAVGRDASTQKQIPFEFTSAPFINAYFSVLHRPLERQGVDFWWIDWQQQNIAWQGEREREYDPLWALNHYHYLESAAARKTPLILSRYAGIGSHRYPLGFSGDTEISWETLAYLPYFTATASNIGYTWWSHDVGGHNLGEKEDELYLRHVQYGVFSPINRLHCSSEETMTKEPWYYLGGVGQLAAEALRFRHALVPYLYTAAYHTTSECKPLIQPLYYRWDLPAAYAYDKQYLFGEELLVSPVTERRKADGYARIRGWLPQGVWTDIFTGDEYEIGAGGKELTFLRALDSIPVFAKAGGILPLSKDEGNGCPNPQSLEVWVYKGKGSYTLYEDGKERGEDRVFLTEFFAEYTQTDGAGTQALIIQSRGTASVIPQNRSLTVRFKNIEKGKIRLFIDGKKASFDGTQTDCAEVKFPFEKGKTYRVEVGFAIESKLEKQKKRAQKQLTLLQGSNVEKQALYLALKKAKTEKQYAVAVKKSSLPDVIKQRLLETLW